MLLQTNLARVTTHYTGREFDQIKKDCAKARTQVQKLQAEREEIKAKLLDRVTDLTNGSISIQDMVTLINKAFD